MLTGASWEPMPNKGGNAWSEIWRAHWSAKRDAQAIYNRLWGAGSLPSRHQGVLLRSSGDPVLFLSDPKGITRADRRRMLDAVAQLNQQEFAKTQDPEILARIAQYEMAYRMQMSVPELTNIQTESQETLDLYGPAVQKPGSFAYNCLMARRLAERGKHTDLLEADGIYAALHADWVTGTKSV